MVEDVVAAGVRPVENGIVEDVAAARRRLEDSMIKGIVEAERLVKGVEAVDQR